LRSAICATRSKAPAVPRRTTPDHLSRRTDWRRWQWQGRRGLPRAGGFGADAFASPGAEVDWSCEDQADWSKRLDVAVGGGSGRADVTAPPSPIPQPRPPPPLRSSLRRPPRLTYRTSHCRPYSRPDVFPCRPYNLGRRPYCRPYINSRRPYRRRSRISRLPQPPQLKLPQSQLHPKNPKKLVERGPRPSIPIPIATPSPPSLKDRGGSVVAEFCPTSDIDIIE
jgi:hypothetical protein